MIRIKAGVTPKNLVIMAAAANAGVVLGVDIVVTSGTDGKHIQGSKHYSGEALDLRTSNLTKEQIQGLIQELKKRLGTNYDIVLESDHLHVEFDPVH